MLGKEPGLRNTVIGVGNLLRADDGVGIYAAHRLKEKRPDIEVVDISTASIEMLEFIRGRDNVVIIDAIKTGAEPGTIHRITPQELRSTSFTSSHSLNLSSVLLLGCQLYKDEMPKKLVILAVEAEDINSYSSELTTKVQLAIPKLLEDVGKEFEVKGA